MKSFSTASPAVAPVNRPGAAQAASQLTRRRATGTAIGAFLSVFLGVSAGAAESAAVKDSGSLGDLSLEELMNETVTSVSKKEQKLSDAAAAISVLTNDDLRRSGAVTVADALRLVPGLNVGSANSSQWAISARGFNNVFSNKLLVMVDGRAVYTPLFAGVYWDMQQTMLEDVDRIEVIRGPGATIWGANAVNGVINVVTRSAKETQGGMIYGGGGNVHLAMGGARYGGKVGEHTYYRVFGGYQLKDDFRLATGQPADDGWQSGNGGFRIDSYPQEGTHLTWQMEATTVDLDDHASDGYNFNTLGRWTRELSARSSFEVQAYYDRTYRNEATRARPLIDTIDLTAQHTFGLGERNDVIWGGGYRFAGSSIKQTTPLAAVRDGRFSQQIFSAFIQDEFKVVPDKLTLTAGTKLEHNDFTGFEVQPSLRAVFKPTERQTVWAAASRAVRTPSSLEAHDVFAIPLGAPFVGPGGGLFVPTLVGGDVSSEVLWAYELGYRIQAADRVSVDLAVFYNDYSDLLTPGSISQFIPGAPVGVAETPWANSQSGETYGGELSVTMSPTDHWRLTASYSLLLANLHGPATTTPETTERSAPRHQLGLRSSYDFSKAFSVDAQARYVDNIQAVSAYITADVRLSYRVNDRLELSLVGQNLLDNQHPEQAVIVLTTSAEVPRGVYGKITWRF
ncbi:MAG: TonB-dependent receptor plug domain-containing protein [Verrucomicrobiota bacterium]